MKLGMVWLVAGFLSACGVETASTAATAAALKKQELEQGQATLNRVQQGIAEAGQQAAQRAAQAEERR